MFEHKLLKTIKDTALQSHRILQVCAPTWCCQLSQIIWETPVLACIASVLFGFRAKKDRGKGFSALAGREMKQTPKNEGGWGGGEGTFPSFMHHPLLTLSLSPFLLSFPTLCSKTARKRLLRRLLKFLACISCSPDWSMKSPGQLPKFTFSCRLKFFNCEILNTLHVSYELCYC